MREECAFLAAVSATHSVHEARASTRMPPRKVLVIAGPTAVGKSAAAMYVAHELSGELISADSVQVYRHLNVGANKPSDEDRRAVRHHLLDIADPASDDYTAGQFYHDARRVTDEVLLRERLPVVVGGTSMYLRWYVYGKPPTAEVSGQVRAEVEEEVSAFGDDWDGALEILAGLDPERASRITRNDWYRLKRSLEIIRDSKQTVTELPNTGASPAAAAPDASHYDFRCFFIAAPREALARRVDQRCEEMLATKGLIDEVKTLLELDKLRSESSAGRAIGYRQTIEYLLSRARARTDGGTAAGASAVGAFRAYLDNFMSATRQYARRQLQWFRNEPNFVWISVNTGDDNAPEACAREIMQLMELSREEHDALLASSDQSQVRQRCISEGRHMKKFISSKHLILPDSDIERSLVRAAEEAADVLSARDIPS
mmetsp:Transcript_1091/g.3391  ORF Transcript_1091/g.3391 Transcript_1091/m.3391 type:complete len:430 (+) Transcript_1091:59-1348(+)